MLKQHLPIFFIFLSVVVHKHRLVVEHEPFLVDVHGVEEVLALVIDGFQLLLKVEVFGEQSCV